MQYQAIVRDHSGKIIANKQVSLRISILQGMMDGNSVYSGTHQPTANIFGLVNLEIGRGTSGDDFSAIDWSMGPYFSKAELDPNGGIDYGVMGTSQLLSVPYALYAKSSGELRFPPLPNDAYVGVLCHNGLALNLVEVAPMTDADGDGDDDPAAFTLFATDFLARPITQDIVYSINRVGETPASNSQSITVTCDDDTQLMIEIHCWDGMVDLGYCETYVLVQDPNSHCH